MFVRLSFDNKQQITIDELESISNTLADKVNHVPLYKEESGDITQFHSWSHTLDPEELKKEDNTKSLVVKTNLVELDTNKEYFADLDLFITTHPSIKIKIRGMVKTIETNFTSLMEEIQYIYNKFENALKGFDKHIEFNEKCNVHIGNLGLLHINQVGYCEDKCTEDLQLLLNQGWRILSVCPQSDQRRPDYIVGRYNPDEENLSCQKL
jgi:hypothetical protein